MLSLDIWQHIINVYICDDVCTIIRLIDCCRLHNESLYMFSLKSPNITQRALKQQKFKKLTELNIADNGHVTNINHLAATLRVLDCSNAIIRQDGITQLRLVKLTILRNKKILSVDHMAGTLRELVCSSECNLYKRGTDKLKSTIITLRDSEPPVFRSYYLLSNDYYTGAILRMSS